MGCHDDGGIAPFTLSNYEAAAQWSTLMADAVEAETMPPWGAYETEACQPAHAWVDDARLSDAEQQLLREWADADAPAGPPDLATTIPLPPDRSLTDVNQIYELPQLELDDEVDSFTCVSFDPGLDAGVWLTGVELIPGNPRVVHHALLMLDATGASANSPCDELHLGAMVGSYFPNSAPTRLPEGVGVPFPVGARIVVGFHHHPTGAGGDVDQSSVALRWTTQPPDYDALISTVGNATSAEGGLLPGPNDPDGIPDFRVPAGAKGHTETMEQVLPPLPEGTRLFMLGPHMHDVGTEIRMTLEHEDEERCLIHDPHWDPDWQSLYVIDAAIEDYPRFIAGDRLALECTYDNSLDNPAVVEALADYGLDAPITVTMGSAALDEMCMFVYGLAIPRAP